MLMRRCLRTASGMAEFMSLVVLGIPLTAANITAMLLNWALVTLVTAQIVFRYFDLREPLKEMNNASH